MGGRRRAAQGEASTAPHRKGIFRIGEHGRIRTGWLLAASLFCYALAAAATRYGLVRAFRALFEAWGVDDTNIHLAPAWARAVYAWHGSLATLACAALMLLIARRLRGLWGLGHPLVEMPDGKLWRSALAGCLAAVIVAALCLLPDSMRPEWPLSEPRLDWRLPLLALLSFAAVAAEEIFTKRVLYDGLRGRWGALWAALTVVAVSGLIGGYAGSVTGALNALLLSGACCALYVRWGLWAAVGFRWGWGLVNMFLLGFGGGDAAVYRLYGVSEALLTGGDAGPMHGLWATAMLAGVIAWTAAKKPHEGKEKCGNE